MSRYQAREGQRIGQQAELDRQLLPTSRELNRKARQIRQLNAEKTSSAFSSWR